MENQLSTQINLKFQPHRLVRNRHFQTVVTSIYHRPPASEFQRATREMMLTVDDGVRLIGYYSPQPAGQTRGLFLLLHGWLGCMDSNYVVELGDYFYRKGYAIFRLNFRDHGGSYHLNAAPFRADRLEEVFTASRQIAELVGDQPMHIVG
ncbi:MAG: hypothetical protein R3264_07560, partial [Anaerolineae bacterium]|nr:hypothetical protein [Anaerolineae bacterium]